MDQIHPPIVYQNVESLSKLYFFAQTKQRKFHDFRTDLVDSQGTLETYVNLSKMIFERKLVKDLTSWLKDALHQNCSR